jgi:hypothetical protein
VDHVTLHLLSFFIKFDLVPKKLSSGSGVWNQMVNHCLVHSFIQSTQSENIMQRLRDLSQQLQQRFRFRKNRGFLERLEAAQKKWEEIKTTMDEADVEVKCVKVQLKRFQQEENGGMEDVKCPFADDTNVATKSSQAYDKMMVGVLNLNLVQLKPGDKVWRMDGPEATPVELVQFRMNPSGEGGSLVWKTSSNVATSFQWKSNYQWNNYEVAFLPMTLKVPHVDDLLSEFVNLDLGGAHKEEVLDVETCKGLYDTFFGPGKAKLWMM